MCLNERNAEKAAMAVGLGKGTYLLVKKLLLLKDKDILTEEESRRVDAALDRINVERQTSGAAADVKDIIKRHWTPRTKRGDTAKDRKKETKLRTRFDRTLFIIREACTNNEEMELPKLNKKEIADAVTILAESITGLSSLLKLIQRD